MAEMGPPSVPARRCLWAIMHFSRAPPPTRAARRSYRRTRRTSSPSTAACRAHPAEDARQILSPLLHRHPHATAKDIPAGSQLWLWFVGLDSSVYGNMHTRRRRRLPSGLRPVVISPRPSLAPAVPRTVLAWAVMLKVNGVVALAAPFQSRHCDNAAGGLSGGQLPATPDDGRRLAARVSAARPADGGVP